jgi:hypothetical protein
MAGDAKMPIFSFMMVRPADLIPEERLQAGYIRDNVLTKGRGMALVDLQSADSPSAVGRLVYQRVFCQGPVPSMGVAMLLLRNEVLQMLPAYKAFCDDADGGAGGAGDDVNRHPLPGGGAIHVQRPQPRTADGRGGGGLGVGEGSNPAGGEILPTVGSVNPLDINDLQRHAYLHLGELFFLLPDQLDAIGAPLATWLPDALSLLQAASQPPAPGGAPAPSFTTDDLVKQVARLFESVTPSALVFQSGRYADAFATTKRALFDALYQLYILRRWVSVNFDPVMDGLRVLHVLEALAIDEIYQREVAGQATQDDKATLAELAHSIPALRQWNSGAAGFPLLASPEDIAVRLAARPVVHPMFAELFYYTRPFNPVRPLGIGDLKVVKQWLLGYEPGEISDIHNVMLGEKNTRNHRRLEKSEDTFASSTSASTDSTTDTQSTDRFELKREAENVIKTDLSVNANLHAQYSYGSMVTVAVGAGFAYNRSSNDQTKSALNLAHEVVGKAVDRVQSTTVSQRNTVKLFETEELNTHTFDNTGGHGHVSGIYRWVDKRYKSQVYNYGKRLMFEFVLPEPAALYVQSRLRWFEATVDLPQMPSEPTYDDVQLGFTVDEINQPRYDQLSLVYDLSAHPHPEPKTEAFVNQATQDAGFHDHTFNANRVWFTRSYPCKLAAPGYQITKLLRSGIIYFSNHGQIEWQDKNFFDISINGTPIVKGDYSIADHKIFRRHSDDIAPDDGPYVLPMDTDDVMLTIGCQNTSYFDLELGAQLEPSPALLAKWRSEVYEAVYQAEKKIVDAANGEKRSQYESALVTYHNRVDQMKATAIHDLIQGQSEAYNTDLVMTELRRQCLAMLTKDFDADASDDVLTDWESMSSRQISIEYERAEVTETAAGAVVAFRPQEQEVPYPLTDLVAARNKGRYIQFLEQAFEWNKLSYLCYPYFWASSPKWMDLMGRLDDADPNFTAFLRAGAIKVLVGVAPAYDEAVLHFLATREPWEGGPSPVIGDPLYLPLFEEIHQQQDDLYGGTPEGDSWEFTLPTSLVYLDGSATPLPTLPQVQP